MGGHAFSRSFVDKAECYHPARYTPRLPPAVYYAIRNEVVKKLTVVFNHVVVPIEHPEKKDFGDIDLLVCSPKGNLSKKMTMHQLKIDIAKALEADDFWDNKKEVGYFAVPVPAEMIELAEVTGNKKEEQLGSNEEYWVQVDIEVVDTASQLGWRVMENAHSTFFQVLRYGLYPAGFRIENKGLCIRIPGSDKNGDGLRFPLIFLTNQVDKILEFFGLSKEAYEKPFSSEDEYWLYATSARHLSRKDLRPSSVPNKAENTDEMHETDDINDMVETIETMDGTTLFNNEVVPAGDRRRGIDGLNKYIGTRTPWKKLVTEWLPAHPYIGTTEPNIDAIFEETLDFFDARRRYVVQDKAHMDYRRDVAFWDTARARLFEVIDPALKKPKEKVNEAVMALKRWVVFESVQSRGKCPKVVEEPQMDDDKHPKWLAETEEGGWTETELLNWIALHGFDIREMDRIRRVRPERELKLEGKRKEKKVMEKSVQNRVSLFQYAF